MFVMDTANGDVLIYALIEILATENMFQERMGTAPRPKGFAVSSYASSVCEGLEFYQTICQDNPVNDSRSSTVDDLQFQCMWTDCPANNPQFSKRCVKTHSRTTFVPDKPHTCHCCSPQQPPLVRDMERRSGESVVTSLLCLVPARSRHTSCIWHHFLGHSPTHLAAVVEVMKFG